MTPNAQGKLDKAVKLYQDEGIKIPDSVVIYYRGNGKVFNTVSAASNWLNKLAASKE